jgi:hypothetical protein
MSVTVLEIRRRCASVRKLFAERLLVRILALVIAVGPLVAVVLIAEPGTGQRAALATSSVTPGWEPDTSSFGSITFTDASGAVITTGSMNAPLAAFAVGSKLAVAADADGSLNVYLPVKDVLPSLWSGEAIGLDTVFKPTPAAWPTNLKALAGGGFPVIPARTTDLTPATFASDFPNLSTDPGYQNLYEVRLFTGTTTAQYDSADILLNQTAGTWQVVYPPASTSLPTSSASPSPSPSHSPSPSPSPTASPSPSPTPSASPSASPTAGAIVATGTSGTLGSNPTLAAGDNVTFQVAGFTASESVGVTLHSTPQTLPPVTASSTGTIGYQFTVGSDLPAGAHTLVFVGATSNKTQTWAFTVAAAQVTDPAPAAASSGSLPFTGTNSGRTLIVGIAALWSGLVLMLVARPRTTIVIPTSRQPSGRHASGRHRAYAAAVGSQITQQQARHRGGRHRR